jgi:hypothetical protein
MTRTHVPSRGWCSTGTLASPTIRDRRGAIPQRGTSAASATSLTSETHSSDFSFKDDGLKRIKILQDGRKLRAARIAISPTAAIMN